MTIPAILKEEDIARMSVRTNRLSEKRLGSVNIVENHLLQIRHLPVSVVHGSVGLAGQKQMLGLCPRNFFVNVHSAARSFGENYLRLRIGAVNFVLVNVRLILSDWISKQFRGFIVLEHGIKRERGYLRETITPASSVVLPEKGWLSIIASLKGMVAPKGMIISLPYVGIATWLNTGIWNARFNSLTFDFCKRIKAIFGEIRGGFLFCWRIDAGWHNAH